ncbi:putative inorganic polyphosphate/ATP-NAD kinase [Pseudobythopirellula maris]|uniref:NAD kinase n=1 Tax=Pseudobythopirellula maris TaxID=2527991 RepID=A0A5C5ZIT8_9BACT|nr:NAD(+)/NADH kinase [Pseudobythopirellula maris]TWT86917.1 putative inorganic polyphosphate/ATP-NAD kinase [Pseudobythopirellula maris]
MPTPPPSRVLLAFDGSRQELRDRAAALAPIVRQHFEVASTHEDLDQAIDEKELGPDGAEWVVAMGGDGTMLRTARAMGRNQAPIVGVNLGRLGFLAGLNPERLDKALGEIAAGKFRIVRHVMLDCTLVAADGAETSRLALNEAAVLAGEPFRMIDAQLYVDGDLAATYSCDGFLVGTPVGSTAHNLAIGGPILRKDIDAVVLSSINPHTLTVRPVVDSPDRTYEIVVADPNPGTRLLVDGKVVGPLRPGDRVRVERSPAVFQMVEVAGQTYYRTLRNKLGWGSRPRAPKETP